MKDFFGALAGSALFAVFLTPMLIYGMAAGGANMLEAMTIPQVYLLCVGISFILVKYGGDE